MIKNYLITGGAGFIGSNIVTKLIKLNNKVIVFDNLSRGKKENLKKINKKIKFINGDIRKINDLYKINIKVDCVCHLAYLNGTKYFYSKPEMVLDVGIKGLVNIFDFCKKKQIKELILFSSSEVYQNPTKIPTNENERLIIPDVYNPRYSYGAGKIITEIMGINYGKKFFDKLLIIRPHNVYGPNMGYEHVIPDLILKFKKIKNNNSQKIEIIGSGKEIRSFIFIDDFIEAFVKILNKGKHLNIYNIGNNEEISIINLTKIIGSLMNKKYRLIKIKGHKGTTLRRCPNITKIKKLSYKQQYSLLDGLKETISWYNN